jgi:hypothetical protein
MFVTTLRNQNALVGRGSSNFGCRRTRLAKTLDLFPHAGWDFRPSQKLKGKIDWLAGCSTGSEIASSRLNQAFLQLLHGFRVWQQRLRQGKPCHNLLAESGIDTWRQSGGKCLAVEPAQHANAVLEFFAVAETRHLF